MLALSLYAIAWLPVVPQAKAAGPHRDVERPLRTSALAYYEGSPLGHGPSSRTFAAVFAYDWNHERFRVVEYGSRKDGHRAFGASYRSCVLSEDQFREVLDGVRDLGLASFPTEDGPNQNDPYRRGVQLRFLHGRDTWSNGKDTGCIPGEASVQPTPKQRELYDAVLAHIRCSLDRFDLQPGSDLHASFAAIESIELAAAYPEIVSRLRSDPRYADLDFNRILSSAHPDELLPGHHDRRTTLASIEFTFLESMHAVSRGTVRWVGSVPLALHDVFEPEARLFEGQRRPIGMAPMPSRDLERSYPELDAESRERIQRGCIVVGMTLREVRAAWGLSFGVCGRGDDWILIYPGRADSEIDLPFRNGRLTRMPFAP